MARFISVSRGKYETIVDDADYDTLMQYNWRLINGYVCTGKETTVFMHRLLTDAPKGMVVDHINRNRLDNRRENLRVCTTRQNIVNSPCRREGGYKGVSRHGKGWAARIRIKGRLIHLGTFPTPEDAARAFDEAAVQEYGVYAHRNIPI